MNRVRAAAPIPADWSFPVTLSVRLPDRAVVARGVVDLDASTTTWTVSVPDVPAPLHADDLATVRRVLEMVGIHLQDDSTDVVIDV